MRIGIFGGTFNPPHRGHLRIAQRAIEDARLDHVVIMPAFTPPHKTAHELCDGAERLEMCRRTFEGEKFIVSDLELRRGGKSYSFDTLTQLRKDYPGDELVFIIGSDMLLCFQNWYRYEEILKLCRLCVFSRQKDIGREELCRHAQMVLGLKEEEITISTFEPMEVSSTQIRLRLQNQQDIHEFVTQKTEKYIVEHKLYMPDTKRTEEFQHLIRNMLRDDRYYHSLGVADSAGQLAKLYGMDEERAYCAGLLHDVTKHCTAEQQLALIKEDGAELSPVEQNNPSLWHAMSGAVYCKNVLHIKDEEIISAVRYHTTGKAGMTDFEKLIYVADFVSAERNYPDVDVMRRWSKISLDQASLYALNFCIPNLVHTGRLIHPDSVNYYNELIIKGVHL